MSTDKTVYLIAWTGGLETPQYEVRPTRIEATSLANEWLADALVTDTIDVLAIDPVACKIVFIG